MNSIGRFTAVAVAVASALLAWPPRLAAQTQPSIPVSAGGESGFSRIFDGKSLAGWEGDPKYWRAEQGCLVGEITPDTLLKQNSFIRAGARRPADEG